MGDSDEEADGIRQRVLDSSDHHSYFSQNQNECKSINKYLNYKINFTAQSYYLCF